jgi:predicted ferric reductase
MSNTTVTGKRGITLLFSFIFSLGMMLFMAYIFGFSIKGSNEYACVLEQVGRNREVTRQLGEPLEPGYFAWLSYSESQGNMRRGAFTTSISGPRDNGRVRAEYYRAPVGSYLYIQFNGGEGWLDLFQGDYPCR